MQQKKGTGEVRTPPVEDIARAWEYHRDADSILHSRIQSFMMAEAFLVAAFAQLASVFHQVGNKGPAIVALCVAVIGFGATFLMASKTHSILRKATYLKNAYLVHDPVYKNYMETGGKRSFIETMTAINAYTITIPLGLAIFWLVMLVICANIIFGMSLF
jgi:hypothetical protein